MWNKLSLPLITPMPGNICLRNCVNWRCLFGGFLTHMEMSPLPVKNFNFDLFSTLMASEVLWRITPTVTLSISLQWSFPRTHDTCTFGSEAVTTCDYDFGVSGLGFDSNAKLLACKANSLTDRGCSILEKHENKKEKRCTASSLQLTWIHSLCELLWLPVVCHRSIFLYVSLSVCKLFTLFSGTFGLFSTEHGTKHSCVKTFQFFS